MRNLDRYIYHTQSRQNGLMVLDEILHKDINGNRWQNYFSLPATQLQQPTTSYLFVISLPIVYFLKHFRLLINTTTISISHSYYRVASFRYIISHCLICYRNQITPCHKSLGTFLLAFHILMLRNSFYCPTFIRNPMQNFYVVFLSLK